MQPNLKTADVLVVGGGLAGLLCAESLGRRGMRVVLLDRPLPAAEGLHGGFSVFSGAKFSLPPAGMGLAEIVGGVDRLIDLCVETLGILGLSEKIPSTWSPAESQRGDESYDSFLRLRRYQSIVLLPEEIRALVRRLHERTADVCEIMNGSVQQVYSDGSTGWVVDAVLGGGERVTLRVSILVLAGGRTFPVDVLPSSIEVQPGRGVDVGMRIGFDSLAGTRKIFQYGADAKFLAGDVRTFCLNHPGRIYWYDVDGIQVPGGVVAESDHLESNVAFLVRLSRRDEAIRSLLKSSHSLVKVSSVGTRQGRLDGSVSNLVASVVGEVVAGKLVAFVSHLHDANLLNLETPHRVHLPLLDWYWPTFALPGTFRSSAVGAWAIGDSSGHARGLLQSAASGLAAAKEIDNGI